MDITINKEIIFKDVSMNVSVIARSLLDNDGNSLYDKVLIQERDKDVLETYFIKAFSVLKTLFRDFLAKVDGLVLSINNPCNKGVLAESIEEMANTYLIERLTADWLKIKAPEYATIYLNESEASLTELRKKLYFKDVPEIKLYGEE